LTGAIKQRPREDRALQTVNGTYREVVKLYVEKKFSEAKEKRR
jgi:predicted metalloendopeptidase